MIYGFTHVKRKHVETLDDSKKYSKLANVKLQNSDGTLAEPVTNISSHNYGIKSILLVSNTIVRVSTISYCCHKRLVVLTNRNSIDFQRHGNMSDNRVLCHNKNPFTSYSYWQISVWIWAGLEMILKSKKKTLTAYSR